jgi:PTS system cellobiose-specific IIC component
VARLGPENLALAIGAALLTVEACSRFLARASASTEAEAPPRISLPAVRGALLSFAMLGLACLLRLALRMTPYGVIIRLANRLVSILSSGPACVLAEAAHSLLWIVGIDGNLILGSALRPLLTGNAVGNGLARWSGQMPQWIYTDLFRAYVTAGGSGATLPLAIYLSRSRSARLRQLGRASLGPGLFNLNAGLIFGTPIIFNPLLALPFVTTTVLNAAAAYMAHVLGWVTPGYIYLPRVIPSPLSALISTGYDTRAAALSMVTCLLIPGIVWLPFFKAWERRVLAAETVADQSGRRWTD